MKQYLFKIGCFSSPFLILMVVYLVRDPFRVLYKHDVYYDNHNPLCDVMNRGTMGLDNWENRSPTHAYDSYIFGNSKAIFYQVDTWAKHIQTSPSSCYHMEAYSESLFGVERKLNYLKEHHAHLKNALILLDTLMLMKVNPVPGFTSGTDYRLTGTSKFYFECTFAEAFFKSGILRLYLNYGINGLGRTNAAKAEYDPVTNEIRKPYWDSLILANPAAFFGPRDHEFYARDNTERISKAVVGTEQIKLLISMATTLRAMGTHFKILITPSYERNKLNPLDLEKMQAIFGIGNVADFSGSTPFNADVHNFYEPEHYRPVMANAIMDSLYKN
jgi:hypothetical protein